MSVISESKRSEVVIDGLHFPESLRWREGLLYFCDMYGDNVQSFDPATGERKVVAELFHPGGIGWLPGGQMLAVASEDRRILEVGAMGNAPYADLSEIAPGWTNDLLVDRQGRAYVGNFGYDLFSEEPRPTQLILVEADRTATVGAGGVAVPERDGLEVRRRAGRGGDVRPPPCRVLRCTPTDTWRRPAP